MLKPLYRAHFNRRHGAKLLPALQPGDHVRVKLDGQKDWQTPATVTAQHSTPRSYMVQTPDETFRRNCRHLQHVPATVPAFQHVTLRELYQDDEQLQPEQTVAAPEIPSSPVQTTGQYLTRFGRRVVPPAGYRE